MIWYDDNTVVIKAKDLKKAKTFFESLGLQFKEEQHGTGPIHYACQVGKSVLELYPDMRISNASADIPPGSERRPLP